MGAKIKIFLLVLIILFAVIYQKYYELSRPLDAPKVDLDFYWGPGEKSAHKENTAVVYSPIIIDRKVIDDLRIRLNETYRIHAPLEGVNDCSYGTNTKVLRNIVDYWRDEYLPKWDEHELNIKSLPHYTTEIQGLKINFIHSKIVSNPKNRKVYPLMIMHGSPGSEVELYNFIRKLSTEAEDEQQILFEVIAPSIPGLGFSEAASKTGFGVLEVAVVFRNLMRRLGHTQYFLHGGNFGHLIGSVMSTLFPDEVLGFHSISCVVADSPISNLKYFLASLKPSWFEKEEYIPFYFPAVQRTLRVLEETGYMHIQSTKPDTIGVVLNNNPIGLAAYILEKWSTWTNPDYRFIEGCGFGKDFTMDQLLDNVMIYYLTNSIQTTVRFYKETFGSPHQFEYKIDRVPTYVPTGCIVLLNDMFNQVGWKVEDKFKNIIQKNHYFEGGHFLAYQKPDVMYKDLMEFIYKVLKL